MDVIMLREKSNDTNKVQPRILARLPYKNSYKIINEFRNWFLKMKFKFRSGCERQKCSFVHRWINQEAEMGLVLTSSSTRYCNLGKVTKSHINYSFFLIILSLKERKTWHACSYLGISGRNVVQSQNSIVMFASLIPIWCQLTY